ncbi:MAG: GvpL/GvpF family gas vesicle protein, partial [bacterium]|nr:GvpL/GvpF family gas vesicle protein [bacterium]
TPPQFNSEGLDGTAVHGLEYKEFVAVVSSVPVKEYEPTEEYTQKHKDVAVELLKGHAVLPVAFGMVFKNSAVLVNTIRQVYGLLKLNLYSVEDKVELGLKIVLPKEESMTPEAIDSLSRECQTVFSTALSPISEKTKELKLFSNRLALNRAFLVKKSNVDAFTKEVEKLREKYPDLKILYTGPWPAYNFVDIQILRRGG